MRPLKQTRGHKEHHHMYSDPPPILRIKHSWLSGSWAHATLLQEAPSHHPPCFLLLQILLGRVNIQLLMVYVKTGKKRQAHSYT